MDWNMRNFLLGHMDISAGQILGWDTWDAKARVMIMTRLWSSATTRTGNEIPIFNNSDVLPLSDTMDAHAICKTWNVIKWWNMGALRQERNERHNDNATSRKHQATLENAYRIDYIVHRLTSKFFAGRWRFPMYDMMVWLYILILPIPQIHRFRTSSPSASPISS